LEGDLAAVVALAGTSLMASAPGGPAQPMGEIAGGVCDQGGEQALDLVAGERNQPVRADSVVVMETCARS
jgi:hypothetical protein